jgi:hypothetical protein
MRANFTLAVLMTFYVAACNNAKSPDTVTKDVAKAEQKASAEVARSEDSAVKDLSGAAGKVDDKVRTLSSRPAPHTTSVKTSGACTPIGVIDVSDFLVCSAARIALSIAGKTSSPF